MKKTLGYKLLFLFVVNACNCHDSKMNVYVVVQIFLWFKKNSNQFNFDFPLSQSHYHNLYKWQGSYAS